jgi:hypothetical protein
MDQVIEFLKGFNVQTILSLAVIVWYFNRHVEAKFEKLELKMDSISTDLKGMIVVEREKLERTSREFTNRSDRLYEEFASQVKIQNSRSDKLYEEFNSQLKVQNSRSDRLYEMFVDLLKDRRGV